TQPQIEFARADASAASAPFGAPRRVGGGSPAAQSAAISEDLGTINFDNANDDLFMVGHVFTPRPEEEFLIP
ncbi:MAG: hypothetical protein WA979_01100, partial [Pacificimonas sp.]